MDQVLDKGNLLFTRPSLKGVIYRSAGPKNLFWVEMCVSVVVLVLKYLLADLKKIESLIFTDFKTALQLLPEGCLRVVGPPNPP